MGRGRLFLGMELPVGILWGLRVTQVWGQLQEVGLFIDISLYSLYPDAPVNPLFGYHDAVWEKELFFSQPLSKAPPAAFVQLPAPCRASAHPQLLCVDQTRSKCSLSPSSVLGQHRFLAPVVWPRVGGAQPITSICWGLFGSSLSGE